MIHVIEVIRVILFILCLISCISFLNAYLKIAYIFDLLDNEEKEKYYDYVKNKYKILNNIDNTILKKMFIFPSFIIYLFIYKEYEVNREIELEILANELIDERNEEIIENDLFINNSYKNLKVN